MHAHPLFSTIDFKEAPGCADDFPRLHIVVRDEIVRLGIPSSVINARDGGTHLKPSEAHALIAAHPNDLVILDARNAAESAIGTFEGSIRPPINHFRELPQYIDQHAALFQDKQVLMHCTGGIRCERASSYLKQHTKARVVYQMEGGIHRYVEQFPNGFFRGKNYVFDRRVAVRITDDILSQCTLCQKSCDDYTNCMNATCNKHFICCTTCIGEYANGCGTVCKELITEYKVKLRPHSVRTKV
jgi:predicted sulfurtransferase